MCGVHDNGSFLWLSNQKSKHTHTHHSRRNVSDDFLMPHIPNLPYHRFICYMVLSDEVSLRANRDENTQSYCIW